MSAPKWYVNGYPEWLEIRENGRALATIWDMHRNGTKTAALFVHAPQMLSLLEQAYIALKKADMAPELVMQIMKVVDAAQGKSVDDRASWYIENT